MMALATTNRLTPTRRALASEDDSRDEDFPMVVVVEVSVRVVPSLSSTAVAKAAVIDSIKTFRGAFAAAEEGFAEDEEGEEDEAEVVGTQVLAPSRGEGINKSPPKVDISPALIIFRWSGVIDFTSLERTVDTAAAAAPKTTELPCRSKLAALATAGREVGDETDKNELCSFSSLMLSLVPSPPVMPPNK